MKKVFLIHGFNGTPNGGWRPYIMKELEKYDIYACALPMPNPEKPNAENWIKEIRTHVKRNSKDEITLVGHSLGGAAILRYLEEYHHPNIKKVIFVSTRVDRKNIDGLASFYYKNFDLDTIKNIQTKFYVIHGDDDPVVSYANGEYLSKKLACELVTIKNGKHLNGGAGFFELPELLEIVLK